MPVISVIVPVYNAEKYINRCIESILNQTFKDFELIIVDDGSKDNSGNICEEYARRDERIKVIHQENKGQASARNRGVLNAAGEWITFVDADDMIQSQMLEYLYRAVKSNNVKMAVCKLMENNECTDNFFLSQKYSCTPIIINENKLLQWCTAANVDIVDKYIYWIVCAKLIHKSIVKYNEKQAIHGHCDEEHAYPLGCQQFLDSHVYLHLFLHKFSPIFRIAQ